MMTLGFKRSHQHVLVLAMNGASSMKLTYYLGYVMVWSTCWLAAGSGTKVAAACKSANCQAKISKKISISYFTDKKTKMTGDDYQKWKC